LCRICRRPSGERRLELAVEHRLVARDDLGEDLLDGLADVGEDVRRPAAEVVGRRDAVQLGHRAVHPAVAEVQVPERHPVRGCREDRVEQRGGGLVHAPRLALPGDLDDDRADAADPAVVAGDRVEARAPVPVLAGQRGRLALDVDVHARDRVGDDLAEDALDLHPGLAEQLGRRATDVVGGRDPVHRRERVVHAPVAALQVPEPQPDRCVVEQRPEQGVGVCIGRHEGPTVVLSRG
jgi:hypothetical protein